jgi:thiol-disulfide isomerase/thioredoxin
MTVVVAEYAGWTARLVISAVFAAAAFGKLAARAAARQAVADFGVPGLLVPAVAWLLPGAEAAVAVAVLPAATAPWAAGAGLALLAVFSAVVARVVFRGEHPACACFGAAGLTRVGVWTLEGLLAGGLPVVLVFLHPGCGPCRLIAGELPRWRQRRAGQVEVVVVSSGTLEENRLWAAEYGITGALVQDRFEVARRYRLRGTPDAVLIGQDGRIRIGAAGGPAGIRSCTSYGWQLNPCPAGLVFNEGADRCDLPD